MSIREFKGKSPKIGNSVYVDDSAVVIGDVTLEDDVSVWPCAVIRGDVAQIFVGAGSSIQDGCLLHGTHRGKYSPDGFTVMLGSGVTVGHRAMLHGCTIGDYSLVGIGSIVMDGSVIEDRVMIGAGSLVPPGKVLRSGSLYVGSPVRRVRQLTTEELEFLQYSGQHYVRLKNEHRAVSGKYT